jgi:Flp pilus assembly protein TadG
MITVRTLLARLRHDAQGAMLIETAIVAPVLVLMSLGAFQVSTMVARQNELQAAAAEASAIALAAMPSTAAQRATVKQVVMTSTGLPSAKVQISEVFRCGTNANYTTNSNGCGSNKRSRYVKLYLTDEYVPIWTSFGVGAPMTFRITRHVMLEQEES